MALKKEKKPELVKNINDVSDGFDTMYPDSSHINQTYNSPISYFNNNDDTDYEETKDTENIEEDNRIQEPIKYESKDDVYPVIRTSKTDDKLQNDLIIRMKERKILTANVYSGKVADVSVEEVDSPKSEKYKRVRFDLEVMNDEPAELVHIDLIASLNLNYNSKLLRIIRAIVGYEVTGAFNLKSLVGEKIIVKTKIITDRYGNYNHAIDTIKKA